MKIAVDIDGTIAEEVDHHSQYHCCTPIYSAIAAINKLYDRGYTIVYYTSRYEEDRDVTKQWLEEHGVKYHELVLGKLRASCYIDNNSFTVEEIIKHGNILR